MYDDEYYVGADGKKKKKQHHTVAGKILGSKAFKIGAGIAATVGSTILLNPEIGVGVDAALIGSEAGAEGAAEAAGEAGLKGLGKKLGKGIGKKIGKKVGKKLASKEGKNMGLGKLEKAIKTGKDAAEKIKGGKGKLGKLFNKGKKLAKDVEDANGEVKKRGGKLGKLFGKRKKKAAKEEIPTDNNFLDPNSPSDVGAQLPSADNAAGSQTLPSSTINDLKKSGTGMDIYKTIHNRNIDHPLEDKESGRLKRYVFPLGMV